MLIMENPVRLFGFAGSVGQFFDWLVGLFGTAQYFILTSADNFRYDSEFRSTVQFREVEL